MEAADITRNIKAKSVLTIIFFPDLIHFTILVIIEIEKKRFKRPTNKLYCNLLTSYHFENESAKEDRNIFIFESLLKKIKKPINSMNIPLIIFIFPKCCLITSVFSRNLDIKSPERKKGIPNPKEKNSSITIPLIIVFEFPARKRIEANIGPIHGDHPAPNAIPSNRLLKNPLFSVL